MPTCARLMTRIRQRGSDGVVLKAPDTPAIRDAVDAMSAADVPVVTLVTDLPGSRRLAYAGPTTGWRAKPPPI